MEEHPNTPVTLVDSYTLMTGDLMQIYIDKHGQRWTCTIDNRQNITWSKVIEVDK